MIEDVIICLLIPFLGTTLGSACVFLLRRPLAVNMERALLGFAGGVMMAAAVWGLLVPSIESATDLGEFAFLPAFTGFWVGTLFMLMLDHAIPHLHLQTTKAEGPHTHMHRTTLLVLAVTIHNIPEGIAVGVVFAGWLAGSSTITFAGATALAIGIAIQNFPEGIIVSLPLRGEGNSRLKSFLLGVGPGAVEPIAAVLVIGASGALVPFMPYLLGFAAGVMIYVVVEELLPEASAGEHSNLGTIMFAAGFTLMMTLDVALG
jgi:zinc transporter, ZIP family